MKSVNDQIRKTASEMVVQSSETIENLRIEKSDLQTEVEKLKEITDATFDAGVRKGIEAATNKIEGMMAPDDWSKTEADAAYRFSYILAERLRAEAKEQVDER